MARSFLVFSFLILAITTHAQEQSDSASRTKEFLITTTSLTSGNYGIQYKVKVFKNAFFRLGAAYLYSENRSANPLTAISYPAKNSSSGFNVILGLEKRKAISESFAFTYGLNLILAGGWTKSRVENPNITESQRTIRSHYFSPGVGLSLGALMRIHENFYLGAEIMPQFLYTYEKNENSGGGIKIHTYRATMNSQNAILALIYRF